MDWIDQLDEDGWNVVIDELAWHIREGRFPVSIQRRFIPVGGLEFQFKDAPAAFLPIEGSLLEDHWDEAVQIISHFPQLQSVHVRNGA